MTFGGKRFRIEYEMTMNSIQANNGILAVILKQRERRHTFD